MECYDQVTQIVQLSDVQNHTTNCLQFNGLSEYRTVHGCTTLCFSMQCFYHQVCIIILLLPFCHSYYHLPTGNGEGYVSCVLGGVC